MTISLGSNIASLQAQRQLFQTEQNLSAVFERLSSGQRINRASDDAAGLAISESLRTDGRVYAQAIRNLNDGISALNIADSTFAELSSVVIRIQELAEQSANGSLSTVQRESLDLEAQELTGEYFRVIETAEFNDTNVITESLTNGLRLQAGYGIDGSILVQVGSEAANGSFGEPQAFGLGASSLGITFGDLDGDGVEDLLAGQGLDYFGSMIGNGDGTFGSPVTFESDTGTGPIRLGDLNGDGILDAVVNNFLEGDIWTFIGNGDGTFEAGDPLPVSGLSDAGEFRLVDLNNDDELDIVYVRPLFLYDDFMVQLGNGDGTFQAAATGGMLGNNPNDLEVGDFDGDGNLDVIAVNRFSNDVNVMLGNGNGSFEVGTTFTVGSQPLAVRVGDLNQDGELDAVIANNADNTISVLYGNGDGTFGGFQDFTAGSQVSSLLLEDLDGDGLLDVAAGSNGSDDLSILYGNGDGTFKAGITYDTNGQGVSKIAAADVNGDGVLDLGVAAGNDALVYLGIPSAQNSSVQQSLNFSLLTQEGARNALETAASRLDLLSSSRGSIGAAQSRIQSALAALQATSENYAAAESRIRDADISYETSQLTRLNILQEAAAAVLGQANLQPSLALTLLQ